MFSHVTCGEMMADDNIDFRLLGRQVQNLQGDVRDLRAGHLRLESDVVGMRADISRIEGALGSVELKVDGLERKVDGLELKVDGLERKVARLDEKVDAHNQANQMQFAQLAQTASTNLQLVLSAISDLQQAVVKIDAKVDAIKRDR
jgi:outer membrane murein-binding lipoprotein Lpp